MTEPRRYTAKFIGSGGDLFVLNLIISIFTMLTVGFYAPWGRVKVIRFFHEHTFFGESQLRFTGAGGQLLRGFLIAGVVFAILYFGFLLLIEAAGGDTIGAFLVVLVWSGLGTWVGHFAYFSSRRFRFAHTTLREIRFRLQGRAVEFAGRGTLKFLIAIVTLGVLYGDYQHFVWSYIYNRLHYGHLPVQYDGDRDELRFLWFKGFFLTILTLGIYFFWWRPRLFNYLVCHLSIGGSRFRAAVQPGAYFQLWLTNALIALLTLGLAWPWVECRNAKFFVEHVSLEGDFDLDAVEQAAKEEGSGFGEGMAEALDMDIDLGL